MNPRVTQVKVLPNYCLQLTFTNNEQKIYDCSSLLDFGIFQELKNKNYFEQVKAVDGTISWPHGQDICPDTLYIMSQVAVGGIRNAPHHPQTL